MCHGIFGLIASILFVTHMDLSSLKNLAFCFSFISSVYESLPGTMGIKKLLFSVKGSNIIAKPSGLVPCEVDLAIISLVQYIFVSC